MIIPVHMLAFNKKGTIRKVDIPYEQGDQAEVEDYLEETFKYGQNDFQPQPMTSVSVGDVIQLGCEYWIVAPMGFKKITEEQFDELPGFLTKCQDIYSKLFYEKAIDHA